MDFLLLGIKDKSILHYRFRKEKNNNNNIEHITKIYDIYVTFKMLVLTFKAIYGIAPSYICNLVKTKEQQRYDLRSSKELLLQSPRTKTKKTLGDRSFQMAAPGLWNKLPSNIRALSNFNLFKGSVKTNFFRKAFACYC